MAKNYLDNTHLESIPKTRTGGYHSYEVRNDKKTTGTRIFIFQLQHNDFINMLRQFVIFSSVFEHLSSYEHL